MSGRIDFSPEDERAMGRAAGWGIFIAVGSVMATAIGLLQSLPTALDVGGEALILALFNGVSSLILAGLLLSACLAFRKVARTDTDDSGELLRGMSHLRYYFAAQVLMVFLGIAGVSAVAMLWRHMTA